MSENLFLYLSILLIIIILGYGIYLIKKYLYFRAITSPMHFSANVQNGYIELLNLLYHNCKKEIIVAKVKNIAKNKTDGRYIGGYTKKTIEFDSLSFTLDYFYELLNFIDSRGEVFILTFNHNSTIEEFHKQLKMALGDMSEHMPFFINNAIEKKLYANKHIIVEYQNKLSKYNIQMAFIDDGSDSYNIILHSLSKEKKVIKSILSIGFNYSTEIR